MASILEKSQLDTFDIARFGIWVEKTSTCWNWVGRIEPDGYGRVETSAGRLMAHRLSWVIEHGSLDGSQYLDHMCHNPACVRPSHLRTANAKQNAENLLPVRASSGYRGVYRAGKKWAAKVKHNGQEHYSGKHLTPESANEAAIALRNKLFTHNILDRAS